MRNHRASCGGFVGSPLETTDKEGGRCKGRGAVLGCGGYLERRKDRRTERAIAVVTAIRERDKDRKKGRKNKKKKKKLGKLVGERRKERQSQTSVARASRCDGFAFGCSSDVGQGQQKLGCKCLDAKVWIGRV